MPSRELSITRSSLKRKKQELISNAPIKKARIQVMKELATKFKESNLNKDNKFTKFNQLQKDIYPWLKKEPLRLHIHASGITKETTVMKDTTKLQESNESILHSFNINQSQVRKLQDSDRSFVCR